MDKDITREDVAAFSQALHASRTATIARNATTTCGVNHAAKNALPQRAYHDTYSVKLSPTGPVTDQKRSGRCWLFAGYNVLRDRAMSSLETTDLELSQAYGQFWDKFEKANLFLERMIELADEPIHSRIVDYWMQAPCDDGGWWENFAAETAKYGVVPKQAMPETAVSESTSEMDEVLARVLRQDALRLRERHAAGDDDATLRGLKEDMLQEVYRILATCLGEPPQTFDFEYVADARTSGEDDKDGDAGKDERKGETPAEKKAREARENEKFVRLEGLTPRDFLDRYVGVDFSDYVSLCNLPGESRPYGRILEMRDVIPTPGTSVRALNEPIEVLKQAAIAQLRDGHPVWFACDVLKNLFRDGKEGLLDTQTLDTEALFDVSYGMDKGQRLDTHELEINHAMTLQGVDLDDEGRPTAWRVENSWGKDFGRDGFLIITDRWMDENLGQVIVDKRYLPADVLSAWETPAEEPIELDPWSPMIGRSD